MTVPGKPAPTGDADRRAGVLEAALRTFARHGYRRTSMDLVAQDADISRQGLYFMFASKEALFRESVERSLAEDLAAVERELARDDGTDLRARLLTAFDLWTGRYLGPLTRDVAAMTQSAPGLLGPVAAAAPERFARLILDAVAEGRDRESAARVARTLVSASIGLKHQVDDRDDYLCRLREAVELLVH